jgi:hypothetical protein
MHDDPSNLHPCVMEIEHHQCELMVFHIIGPKCGIQKNSHVMTKLEHGLKLHKCLDPYGEWDLSPIHLTCILNKKHHQGEHKPMTK